MKISKLPKKLRDQLAQRIQLQVDAESGLLFGTKNGFHTTVYVLDRYFQTFITLSVSQNGQAPNTALLEQFVQAHKELSNCTVSGYTVSFLISSGATAKSSMEKIANSLAIITQFLSEQGFENCCENCGARDLPSEAYVLTGTPVWMCSACFQQRAQTIHAQPAASENIIAGLVGAFLGSLLGVLAMVIFGQMGRISAISGLILAVCAIKGYEMLGGTTSKKGLFLSMLIVLGMTYVGNYLDWAVSAMFALEIDFFSAVRAIPLLFEEGAIDPVAFYGNLALQYLFVLLGAVPTISTALRSKQEENITHKMAS